MDDWALEENRIAVRKQKNNIIEELCANVRAMSKKVGASQVRELSEAEKLVGLADIAQGSSAVGGAGGASRLLQGRNAKVVPEPEPEDPDAAEMDGSYQEGSADSNGEEEDEGDEAGQNTNIDALLDDDLYEGEDA
jgi:hypothetical protein